MLQKYIIPLLAILGVGGAILMVINGNKPVPAATPITQPATSPYPYQVAGSGIVEASTENIAIGSPLPGVVTEVMVVVGDMVKKGAPLFRLDDRSLQAELLVKQSALRQAREKLARLKSMPRPEDIPPAEARVARSQAALEDLKAQLSFWEGVADKRAISQEEFSRKRFAVKTAEAMLTEAKAELALLMAGTWKPDLDVVAAEVAAAEAQVQATTTELERLVVKAPVDGQVLQVKVRVGEFAQASSGQKLILLGNVSTLHVRVDVDENDAWRVRASAPAVASVRGNPTIKTDLKFVRFEPYIVPKQSLTGDNTERVDTRVLQVVYSFDAAGNKKIPVYVGEQMDVFIESLPPVAAPTGNQSGMTKPE